MSDFPGDHPTSGRVTLVFEDKGGSITRFTRAIVESGAGDSATYASRYQVGERIVTMDGFMEELLKIGINTKARNFLVFQVREFCFRGSLGVEFVRIMTT
jgi:hypothetical protein